MNSRYLLVDRPTPSSSSSSTAKLLVDEESAIHSSTHLNASLNAGALTSTRRKSKSRTEMSRAYGNDSVAPFLKVPSARQQVFTTVETTIPFNWLTSNAALPTFASANFTVNQVPDFSSFSAIFDQYMITEVEVTIEPQVSEVVTVAGDVGNLVSVTDLDDSNTPTALSDLGSYPNVLITKGTQSHYHRWKPTVALAAYSGTFTSYAAAENQWLDCGSPNIQHYGLKAGCTASPTIQSYSLSIRLHVAFRARH